MFYQQTNHHCYIAQVFYEEELDVPLVLFDEVLDHVLRIDRIFRQLVLIVSCSFFLLGFILILFLIGLCLLFPFLDPDFFLSFYRR